MPAEGTKGQPAMVQTDACATAGWPDSSTRAEGVVGRACPPCEHMTVAPRCRMGPLIALSLPLQITTSAPLFTVTVGPVMMIEAPLPFWM